MRNAECGMWWWWRFIEVRLVSSLWIYEVWRYGDKRRVLAGL